MTASAPDPRHRALELFQRHLDDEGLAPSERLARRLLTCLEAAGLAVVDAPGRRPHGFCDFHQKPLPCDGCAADAKAAPDPEEEG